MIIFYYIYNSKSINKIKYIVYIILLLYLLTINASRTLIGMSILNLILIIIFINVYNSKIRSNRQNILYNSLKFIIYIAIITIISYFVVSYLNSTNSLIIERFTDIFSREGSFTSVTSREITNQYYMDFIKQNPLGYGFGGFMPLINPNYIFYQLDWFYTDQAVITLMYKCGVVPIVILAVFIINIYIKNLKLYYRTRREEYFILSMTIPVFLLSMYTTSSQIIHSPVIYLFTWTYFAIINSEYKNMVINKEKYFIKN